MLINYSSIRQSTLVVNYHQWCFFGLVENGELLWRKLAQLRAVNIVSTHECAETMNYLLWTNFIV